jgi:hypothetical protein
MSKHVLLRLSSHEAVVTWFVTGGGRKTSHRKIWGLLKESRNSSGCGNGTDPLHASPICRGSSRATIRAVNACAKEHQRVG